MQAEKIKASAIIEITKLQRRSINRLLQEESEKQKIGLEKDQEDITINKIPEVINKFEAITGTKEFEDWK